MLTRSSRYRRARFPATINGAASTSLRASLFFILPLLCTFTLGFVRAESHRPPNKPVAYVDTTHLSPEDREVMRAFAGKYRLEETDLHAGFTAARPKGEWVAPDVRLYRAIDDLLQPGKFLIGFVVGLDGHVADPRVLESNNQYIAELLVQSLLTRRAIPARFRGVSVLSVRALKLTVPFVRGRGNQPGRNGLGILSGG